jgi:hypothetical protein
LLLNPEDWADFQEGGPVGKAINDLLDSREVEPSQGHPESNLAEKLIYQDSLRVQPHGEGILGMGSGMRSVKRKRGQIGTLAYY